MSFAFRFVVPFVFFLLVTYFCEYFIYFAVLKSCSWPNVGEPVGTSKPLRALILADTHLLGIRKGHWLDKVRREWQMYRTFQAANELHNPDIVFILGDLLDEGSFSPDRLYNDYLDTFFRIFSVPEHTELHVVPGNHDIGFHYAMSSYLEYRFDKSMNTSSVQLLTINDVHFVLLNSMAMENDGCYICSMAEHRVERISAKLACSNETSYCTNSDTKLKKYSRPVLLQHFPLYRRNDQHCNEDDEAPVHEKSKIFKERWDCLSKKSTDFLLDKLHPRVVFSGHTHHGCLTRKRKDIFEYSVSSFNWRNKNNPSFLMVTFTSDTYAVQKCFIPRESTVYIIYVATILVQFIYIVYYNRIRNRLSRFVKLRSKKVI